jgi:TolB-like protein
LVQVFLDDCDPPLFFGERQGISLVDWSGSIRHDRFDRLEEALRHILNSPGPAGHDGDDLERRPKTRDFHPKALILGLAAITLVGLGGWRWWETKRTNEPQSRIAIQPIEAPGGTAALTATASSLTDQIAISLGDGHIPTLGRSDSENLQGGDSDRKLQALGVGYTLNGTLEASGNILHARLRLDDRARHASLWSYELTGSTADAAMLNSKAARSIAGVISCAYRGLGPGGLTDTELLGRYLRVCDLFVNHNDATDFKSMFELFDNLRQIMAKAPNFAPAQSDFAKFAAYLAPLLPTDQAFVIRAEASDAARRALKINPHAADAYVAQEMLLPPTEWAKREALLRKAVSVDPKWPHSNGFLGMFLTETGRMREAAIYGQKAAAADLQIDWKPYGAKMACDAGQTDVAIADLRQRVSNSPSDEASKWALRWCLLDAGHVLEAKAMDPTSANRSLADLRSAAEEVMNTGNPIARERARQIGMKMATDESIARSVIPWSAAAGDLDTAFRFADTLSAGYPTTGIIDLLFTPQTEPMRRDPRFSTLAKRLGLHQFWQTTGRWPDFCSGSKLSVCHPQGPRPNRSKLQ